MRPDGLGATAAMAGSLHRPYNHPIDTAAGMKTTLNLDPQLLARLEQAAARQGKTMSALVETALLRLLQEHPVAAKNLPPLPSFDGGGEPVDVAGRDELYRAMDGH
jgi:Ribbon-helix-helix protein, copG family